MDKAVTLSVILMLVGSVTCGYVVARLGWRGAARLEGVRGLLGWVVAGPGEGGCGAGGRWQGQVKVAAVPVGGGRARW